MKSGKRRAQAQSQSATSPAKGAVRSPAPAAAGDTITWVVCIVLAVLTLLLYEEARHFEFQVLDDLEYVKDSAQVQSGLTLASLKWAFTGTQVANWHPITTLSLILTSQVFGINAAAFHLVNVLFHVANVLLAFLVLKKITGAFWQSAIVAALFAWHPLHIESVAWIAERKDVLSGLFFWLTIWTYARWVETGRRSQYLAALACLALGLMSKAMLVTMPFVLLLLDYWPLRRWQDGKESAWAGCRKGLREKAPFFLLSLIFSVITYAVQHERGAVANVERFTLEERLGNAVVSYERYLEKTFWPTDLAVIYPHPGAWPGARIGLAVAVLLVITGIVVWQWRQRPYLGVGWFWFLGMLVPVIGLVQVGSQSMADRYTYLPLCGVFFMVVWGIDEWLAKVPQGNAIRQGAAGCALAACLAVSWQQLPHWQSFETLLQHATRVTKGNEYAHAILADGYAMNGRLEEAVGEYRESLTIQPGNPEVLFSLGTALSRLGRPDEAEKEYRALLNVNPRKGEAYYNLGNIQLHRGQVAEAAESYKEAARLNPGSADTENNLATSYLMLGKLDEAATHYVEALRINPNYENAQSNLGVIRMSQGRTEEAIAAFKAALRIRADFVPAMDRLAWLLATHEDGKYRDGAQAVTLAERACEITKWTRPGLMDVLAAAYASSGRFKEAVEMEKKALGAAAKIETLETVKAMQQRMILFQNGKVYLEAVKK